MSNRAPLIKVSVIVPTYRRTADLARCLAALDAQQRRADEVIVIARHDDHATLQWLRDQDAKRPDSRRCVALVRKPDIVAAYNLGIERASGDVLCFTDDSAAAHGDWIARIVRAFGSNAALGGLGGRDIVHERTDVVRGARPRASSAHGRKPRVGAVLWYGRVIGNHHIGYGQPREVQVLKGVNMAFRRDAIGSLRFDPRLRGNRAQAHCETSFSLDVRRRGWTLIYDPSLRVEHFPAAQDNEDSRGSFNDAAFYNASFNFRLIMCEYLSPAGRFAFVAYSTLIGERSDPGFLRALSFAFERGGLGLAMRKWRVGLRAMRGAWHEAVR